MEVSKGRRFYGTVTVSERGQIVIPAKARRDFDIKVGDKLLVLGDLSQGLAIAKASVIIEGLSDAMSMFKSSLEDTDPEADSE
jgi:AbrB family looped-hinge helix DNA binding protein